MTVITIFVYNINFKLDPIKNYNYKDYQQKIYIHFLKIFILKL